MKIPKNTNVTIQLPKQNNPLEFVPYPYMQSGNKPQCYKCQGSKCEKCENFNPNAKPVRPPTHKKTNIVIDLTKTKSNPSSGGKSNDPGKNGTVIVLQDTTSASSASQSLASGNTGTSAASSAATSTSHTDVIASINENSSNGQTEDIFVEDASKSAAGSKSSASAGMIPQDRQNMDKSHDHKHHDHKHPEHEHHEHEHHKHEPHKHKHHEHKDHEHKNHEHKSHDHEEPRDNKPKK